VKVELRDPNEEPIVGYGAAEASRRLAKAFGTPLPLDLELEGSWRCPHCGKVFVGYTRRWAPTAQKRGFLEREEAAMP
jgi:hypothetical protein